MRAVDGACLFVLDDEGVFFWPARQELYVFNTAATFVWCCLLEGYSPAAMVQAYRDAFAVGPDEARTDVFAMLNRWWAFGYIDGPGIPDGRELPLTTVLARLLSNPALRRQLSRSRRTLAKKLGVRMSDLSAFMSLEAYQLDAQAEVLRARALAVRRSSSKYVETVLACVLDRTDASSSQAEAMPRGLDLRPPVTERRYRMLGTDFCLRFTSADQERRVHPSLAHLARDGAEEAHVSFDVIETREGHIVREGSAPVAHCRRPGELTPQLKSLFRQRALNRYRFFMEIHAGVVSTGEKCILLPGPPGSGKSTLTAGLAFSGLEYLSDEVVLLEEESLHVRAVPLALGVKPRAVAVLAPLCPEVRELEVHDREDGQRVRYLSPRVFPRVGMDVVRPAGWVIFPRYEAGVSTLLRPLARPEALRRLMRECMVLPDLLDQTRVEGLVRWMRNLECFELPMGSLTQAVDLIRRLCLTSIAARS